MLPKSSLELQWKEHRVNLEAFSAWVKELEPSCCGTSADSKLTVWFMEQVSEEVKAAVEAKWAECDDAEHELVKSYVSSEQLAAKKAAKEEAVKAKKLAMLSKSWDEMSVVERKIMMGLEAQLNDSELGL